MKTAIRLTFVYLAMQIGGIILGIPFSLLYTYLTEGTVSAERMEANLQVPAMLIAFAWMFFYLRREGHLHGDRKRYAFPSAAILAAALGMGMASIAWIDFLMTFLTFLPDWMKQAFESLQSTPMGILCICLFGPMIEELLFRGAITTVLLQRYRPVKAILLSALIFGVFHLNPPQIIAATLSGVPLAWLYYRTGSLIPGMAVHVLNNSLSVFLSLRHPEASHIGETMGKTGYAVFLSVSIVVFFASLFVLQKKSEKSANDAEPNLSER